jgi:hypothetical protein
MQNLINELTQPRQLPPSQAMLRAAKALQELAQLHQADLNGRLEAERKLCKAEGELVLLQRDIQRLQGLLNEKNTNSVNTNDSANPIPPSGT